MTRCAQGKLRGDIEVAADRPITGTVLTVVRRIFAGLCRLCRRFLVDFGRDLARIVDTASDAGDRGIQTGSWCYGHIHPYSIKSCTGSSGAIPG